MEDQISDLTKDMADDVAKQFDEWYKAIPLLLRLMSTKEICRSAFKAGALIGIHASEEVFSEAAASSVIDFKTQLQAGGTRPPGVYIAGQYKGTLNLNDVRVINELRKREEVEMVGLNFSASTGFKWTLIVTPNDPYNLTSDTSKDLFYGR